MQVIVVHVAGELTVTEVRVFTGLFQRVDDATPEFGPNEPGLRGSNRRGSAPTEPHVRIHPG